MSLALCSSDLHRSFWLYAHYPTLFERACDFDHWEHHGSQAQQYDLGLKRQPMGSDTALAGLRSSHVRFRTDDLFIRPAPSPDQRDNGDDSGSLSYSATNPVAGLSWLEALGDNNAMLFLAGFGGKENAVNERPDGDKRLTGLRGALQFAALPNLDCYASFGKQYGRYDNSNFAFDYMRRDIQTEAAAGLVWRMIGDVSVRPGISYTRNRSNIEINDYRRTEYLLTVRYDIR